MKKNYRVILSRNGVKQDICWIFNNKTIQKVKMIVKEWIQAQHHECNYVIEEI